MSADKEQRTIECPECGAEIDVDAILRHQLEEELSSQYKAQLEKERKKYDKKAAELGKEQADLEEQKKKLEASIKAGVSKQVSAERQKIEAQLRKSISEEMAESTKSLQDELAKKTDQVKELNKARADVSRLIREKDELKSEIESEAQRKLTKAIQDERKKIQKAAEDRVELKLIEQKKLVEQLTTQLREAQRKAEQGSMQAQGEAQEIAIEEWLRDEFSIDTIEEIKKGVRGADCIHRINTPRRQNVGSVYYESKRTKDFQSNWITKFKDDMRANGATFGVIVTEAMPKDMDRMGQKDGVWICSFEEFKGLSRVLRESVIQVNNAFSFQENKGDKMTMIYKYVTSTEFRLQIEAIVDGFSQLQTGLATEKRQMESLWKKREKEIERVLQSTTHMYGSIRGIAGNAVQAVAQLEFKEDESE